MVTNQNRISNRKPTARRRAPVEEMAAVDPSEALEAVHALMHLFAAKNHDFRRGFIAGNEMAYGLKFHQPISVAISSPVPNRQDFGFLGFGNELAELYFIVKHETMGGELPGFISRFLYNDPKLLQHIVETLPAVGVVVPDHLTPEVERLKAELTKKAQDRDERREFWDSVFQAESSDESDGDEGYASAPRSATCWPGRFFSCWQWPLLLAPFA